ncbi:MULTISPECIES: hypothetical protein [Mycobacterium]|uniref:PE-PPE domain-containing protein n=1 Tax=Mycobacterium syngnathidarum TaxID=1908205 RepID=A0A1S1K6T6_9MYCO|nr:MULTISPECIES: hypothetical protein [Mycobacterium]MCG7607724.1 hypothetical protein [Mycobacterium sp. CnD-18-1]OHU01191.1 hypothetical protein BKG61_11545 [Mycobacterium syngnathidarum]
MALRPVLITGVALASAGAIVAATPGLMTPPDIAVTAGVATAAPAKKTVTVDQLNLLGLSDIDLQFVADIFFRTDGYGGHVGGTYDPYYSGVYGQHELSVVVDGVDEDGKPVQYLVRARNADGKLLNAYLDENGDPILVGNDDEGNPQTVPVYILDENGDLVQVNDEGDDPTYWTDPISGNFYRDGLVGLAYYLGDLALEDVMDTNVPVISDAAAFVYNNVTSYFYEAGIEETFRVVASELTGGPDGLGAQLLATAEDLSYNWMSYAGTVAILAASGVPLAGPELAAATSIFFFGGAVETDGKEYNQGIDGVINYVVDRVIGAATTVPEDPDEDGSNSEDAGNSLTDTAAAKSGTAVLASARKALPALDNLINLDLKIQDSAEADDASPAIDKTEGAPDAITPVSEVSKPTAPTLELPKLPKLDLDLTPKIEQKEVKEVKAPAAEEKSTEEPASEERSTDEKSTDEKAGEDKSTDAGTSAGAGKSPNKFTPKSRITERKKSAGEKFVEKAAGDLKKAFTPKTKAGADKKHENAKPDSDSGAKAGNAHAGSNDKKGNGDNKGHKDK